MRLQVGDRNKHDLLENDNKGEVYGGLPRPVILYALCKLPEAFLPKSMKFEPARKVTQLETWWTQQ